MRFLFRLLVNAAALWIAARLVPGITWGGDWINLVAVALVFGVVNTLVRPIFKFFSIPALIVTLGLFIFVINGLMLWLTSAISGALGLGFHVSGFGAAFLGALVVSVVSFALNLLAPEREEPRRKEDR